MGFVRNLLLRGSRSRRLARTLPRLPFFRRATRRFMPGEDVEDALGESAVLGEKGVGAVLTLLGENVSDRREAGAVTRHYLELIEALDGRGLDAEISVKLTQLGLDLGPEVAAGELAQLVERAAGLGTFVWVDMEGSAYTEVTLGLFREVRRGWPNVGLCLQAYLHRTPADLEALLPLHPSIRLVKGAYAEPASVALASRRDVDARYLELAERLLEPDALEGGARHAFGTHDERLVRAVIERGRVREVAPELREIHMLYGIRRELQRRLVEEGEGVRVLISYGPAWFPWYMRRLAERPANVWFVLRSLFAR